jgi:DNA polymerase
LEDWAELGEFYQEIKDCRKCPLWKTRTNLVFGSGSQRARVMFIGEAPGYHEDKQGKPFVGAAGQLLDSLLSSIGLKREEVFIGNVLKCRPPENRDPLLQEIETCKGYLYRQIEIINPPVICTLGRFSTNLILGREVSISKVRGKIFKVNGRTLIPIFHPAAALYTRANLPLLEADFQAIKQVLEYAQEEAVEELPEGGDEVAEQLGFW